MCQCHGMEEARSSILLMLHSDLTCVGERMCALRWPVARRRLTRRRDPTRAEASRTSVVPKLQSLNKQNEWNILHWASVLGPLRNDKKAAPQEPPGGRQYVLLDTFTDNQRAFRVI